MDRLKVVDRNIGFQMNVLVFASSEGSELFT